MNPAKENILLPVSVEALIQAGRGEANADNE